MSKKKLLITGASGFLGSRAAAYFGHSYEVLAPAHSEMDITDEKSVEAVFLRIRPEIVLHCAAVSDVGLCGREKVYSERINLTGSINIAKAAGLVSAKCVLCSSDQVYFGSVGKGPHSEEEDLCPANEYGRQKLLAEQECLRVNPDCVLLRLSWMYDRKTQNIAEHGDFLRILLSKREQKETLSYPVHDIRGISYVQEVVRNLEKTFSIGGGVYNFGSPNDRNTYAMMYQIFEDLGWDANMLEKNTDAFRENPRNLSMCQKKINAEGIYFKSTKEQISDILRATK